MMIWMVEKKIFHHVLDLGFESVRIPVRTKFEFNLQNRKLIAESLSYQLLYNLQVLEKRYPQLKAEELDRQIQNTVQRKVHMYLKDCGYIDRDQLPENLE
jgi:hypothetical protein